MKRISKKVPHFFFYAAVILMSAFLVMGCASSDSGDDDKKPSATDTATEGEGEVIDDTATTSETDTDTVTDTSTVTDPVTSTDTNTAPEPNPNPNPQPTPTPTATDTNTATDPGLQLSDLVGTYRLVGFSMTGPQGNTIDQNSPAITSFNGQMTITANGSATYTWSINGQGQDPIQFRITQVRDTEIQFYMAAQNCTDWAGIRMNGNNFTLTMSNACGQQGTLVSRFSRTSRQVTSYSETFDQVETILIEESFEE